VTIVFGAGTAIWWIRYRDRKGIARRESSLTADWNEANRKLRERLQARDNNLLDVIRRGETLSYGQWADVFLENYSKPPVRAEQTHEANQRCIKHLKASFGESRLVNITADSIELYLRDRLRQRVRVKVKLGFKQLGAIKASTVHQEFRVLRRMLNVAVRKKLLPLNSCSAVEFPVAVKGLFRPHYVQIDHLFARMRRLNTYEAKTNAMTSSGSSLSQGLPLLFRCE
jgi:hypothetical protein